ncbi:hypothetical protein EB796_013988 [Bugula neritina]|uniref:C2H2-type domain-containing protein n=1 Tax=Bugula neritina TaxID=10212 RepID=A0A7J7JPZ3_BUGNE|nr:hypothetical protein EB796_013988 [Bugula neritina]
MFQSPTQKNSNTNTVHYMWVHKITVTSLSLQNADADTNEQLDRSFESEDLDWLENCHSDDDHNEETIPVKERRILKPKAEEKSSSPVELEAPRTIECGDQKGSEKKYNCTLCEFRSAYSSSLKRHLRTHSGEKPYNCTLCEFKSATSSNLKNHLRTHSGEKPYNCTLCEFRCAQSSDLQNHLRTHSGKKPYNCTLCEFRSATSSSLKRHLRTHSGEKPYNCTLCEFRSATSSNLKKHIRAQHADEKP